MSGRGKGDIKLKKLRIVTIVVLSIIALFIVTKIVQVMNKEVITSNQVGDRVEVTGEVLNTGKLKFRTDYQLDSADILSWIDLVLETDIEYNSEKNKYELINPMLFINTIGCDEYERKNATITSSKYENIYRFGVDLNQKFSQEIKIKYAKQLAKSKNVEITKIIDKNNIGIDSIRNLVNSEEDDKKVVLEFKFKEPYSFKGYFSITFELVSDKEGYFIVQ